MYSSVNTRGLSDTALRAARREITEVVAALVAGHGIDANVYCDVPGGMVGPGVIVEGHHDALFLQTPRRDAEAGEATLPRVPDLPEGEQARLVWAHVDGREWQACWPECQRVYVQWRDDVLAIPGPELAARVVERRAYERALDHYAHALAGVLAGAAASLWFAYEPERGDGHDEVAAGADAAATLASVGRIV